MMRSAAGEYVAGHRSMTRRGPVGPMAAISPSSSLRLEELLQDALPGGLLNVPRGRGRMIGDRFVNGPEMEEITVTAASANDVDAMRAAGRQSRHVHLERGGKAPVIVFDKAVPEAVAKTTRYESTRIDTHGVGTPEMPWAAKKGLGTGCDMSVYALDAHTSVRHAMVAH